MIFLELELAIANDNKVCISGTFEVVTQRNASDVPRSADLGPQNEEAIGQTITFTADELIMEGMSCQHWEVLMTLVPIINLQDPMLADIHMPPTDSLNSAGDKRIGKTYHYMCEGENFLHVYQVDNQVLVIPWENSSSYLIAERPLSSDQIKTFQAKLRDMKFNEEEPNGELDDNTLAAISNWSNYRLGVNKGYNFKRTAITENLLDTLDVLE